MFAGIIEGLGTIQDIETTVDGAHLSVVAPFNSSTLTIGCSIAVNGACLTVEKITKVSTHTSLVTFTAVNETLRKTNLGLLKSGSKVNLERSLLIGGRIDGHFVSGHIDETAAVIEKKEEGVSIKFVISAPDELRKFIAPKGSITVNGVSLTVGEVTSNSFEFYTIPHTAEVTNLGALLCGDIVNLEVDLIARYVTNFLQCSQHSKVEPNG